MQIDSDYLKEIFDVFISSKTSTVDWDDFKKYWTDSDDKFVFHIEIMQDNNLIEGVHSSNSLGIRRDSGGEYNIGITPWRLTAGGHDFAKALSKPDVFNRIKDKFAKEGISVVIDVAKHLIKEAVNKRLGGL